MSLDESGIQHATIVSEPTPVKLHTYQKWLGFCLAATTILLLAAVVVIWPAASSDAGLSPKLATELAEARQKAADADRALLAQAPRTGDQRAAEVIVATLAKLEESRSAALKTLSEKQAAVGDAALERPVGVCLGRTCLGAEARLLLLAALAGALGSAAHACTSLAGHSGAGRMTPSWVLWYVLRIPAGAAIGVVAYWVVRAGFVMGTVNVPGTGVTAVNPFGVAAVSALAGVAAKTIMDRFDVLATGLMGASTTQRSSAKPSMPKVDRNSKTLTMNFDREPTDLLVKIDGREAPTEISGKVATVKLNEEEAKRAPLQLSLSGAGLANNTPLTVP